MLLLASVSEFLSGMASVYRLVKELEYRWGQEYWLRLGLVSELPWMWELGWRSETASVFRSVLGLAFELGAVC